MSVFSWGRTFNHQHHLIQPTWQSEWQQIKSWSGQNLAYGLGRSYGDSCLNDKQNLILTRGLNRLIQADWQKGLVRCQPGMSIDELLKIAVPKGFFVPVTPGTKFVTLAGALANDVHGKNHHHHGTFGCHVPSFELLRSSGQRITCRLTENADLYRATIGGLGLTGIITWLDLQLTPITSSLIRSEVIKFNCLEEFLLLSQDSEANYTYTVAWFDCMQDHNRGHFIRGNHERSKYGPLRAHKDPSLSVPIDFPHTVLNPTTMKLFNQVYYHRLWQDHSYTLAPYEPFFYPLDKIHHWNRIYGRRGFFQYQFILPMEEQKCFGSILDQIRTSKLGSFLAVLKTFGNHPSPGMMSFPRQGFTLCLDFPNRGQATLALFKQLEDMILKHGGCFYPAKDSTMSRKAFQQSYPNLEKFKEYVDPNFSSSFWRRVQG